MAEPSSHYKTVERIGEGGTRVVYEVPDTHLDRFVAITVLPDFLTLDREPVLSQLNHEVVAGVHDVEESSGQYTLVKEPAKDHTLAEQQAAGPTPRTMNLTVFRGLIRKSDAQ